MNTQYPNQNNEKIPNRQRRITKTRIEHWGLWIFSGFGFGDWLLPGKRALIGAYIVIAFFVLLVGIPLAVEAAEWKGLVPACGATPAAIPGAGGETTRTYTPCSTCDLAALVKKVLDFVVLNVALAGVALMLMIGGFQMITGAWGGSASAHQKGLATIKNAFIGLAIVLFAWLAVDTVIKFIAQQSLTSGSPAKLFENEPGAGDLVDPEFSISSREIGYGVWNKIKCTKLDPVKVVTKPPPQSARGGTVAQIYGSDHVCNGQGPQYVNGVDVCDPIIRQNIENNARNPEGAALREPLGTVCENRSGVLSAYVGPIEESAKSAQLDPERFVALLMHESNGQVNAISPKGAVGLGQVLPSTACSPEVKPKLKNPPPCGDTQAVINWLKVPENNIQASALYLRSRYDLNGGNRGFAEAAYNGGQYANAPSVHCPGVTRWQCPYDSFKSGGGSCWPNPSSSECKKNIGYAATRNYSPALTVLEDKIKRGVCKPIIL